MTLGEPAGGDQRWGIAEHAAVAGGGTCPSILSAAT